MKVRDYSDTAGPGARKVDRPGGPQKRIDLTPASGRSRCGAPTMTLRYAQPSPQSTCTKPGDSSIPVAVSVAVRRGTRGHPGARGTDESRAIPRTTRVLLALPNGLPSWTSPVRPRSPALSRSSSPRVAGATVGSQGLTTPGWAQRPRRVATLPEPPSGRGPLCLQTATLTPRPGAARVAGARRRERRGPGARART